MSEREDRLAELLAQAMQYEPTPREREEQVFSLAYGNLAMTTNHRPSRAGFAKMAEERGWTKEEFDVWAATRQWW